MSYYVSRDSRRILNHLEEYDISISDPKHLLDVEICLSRFYPNHVIGVIDKCLSGKNLLKKLGRAQQRSWNYFKKPVRDLLSSRKPAHRKNPPNQEKLLSEGWVSKVYSIVTSSLLINDMSREEADKLIYEVPHYARDRMDLVHAITPCKEHGSRNVHYLLGVLRNEREREEGRTKELLKRRSKGEPWEPDEESRLSEEEVKDFERRWNIDSQENINIEQSLREYAADSES